jgi:hypothetical protein
LVFRAQYPLQARQPAAPEHDGLLAATDKYLRRELAGNNARKHKLFEWQAPNRTSSDWAEVHSGLDGRAVSPVPGRTFLSGTPETGFILAIGLLFITEAKELFAV